MDLPKMIRNVLGPTACPMEIPPACGLFHLGFMIPGFALCFFLAWRLRRLDDQKAGSCFLALCS